MVSSPPKIPQLELPPAAKLIYESEQIDWRPFPLQMPLAACRKQYEGASGGEGGGKSELAAKIFLARFFEDRARKIELGLGGEGKGPPLLYWLVGDDYSQVTQEFHYIEQDLTGLGFPIDASKPVNPGHITMKYSEHKQPIMVLETKSGTDPSKISRVRPDGIILCEAGQISHMIFDRCYGRATQGGGWFLMIGTLEGSQGWFPQTLEAWASGYGKYQSFELPSWANEFLYPGGYDDPKIQELKATHSDEYFMERMAGKRVPPKGLVFPEFRADLHIRECSYDPGYASTSTTHAHAVLIAQNIDNQIRVFDEIYERGLTTQRLIWMCQRRPWWKAPQGKILVSDPHYKDQHHSVNSVSEVWFQEAGLRANGERVHVLPGIERFKTFLLPHPITGIPGIVFDPSCQGILSELGAAVDPFDQKSHHPWMYHVTREGEIAGEEPLDAYNDACKAIIYGLVYNYGYATTEKRKGITVRHRRELQKA